MKIVTVCIAIQLFSSITAGVEMMSTPVQSAFKASLLDMGVSQPNEFDQGSNSTVEQTESGDEVSTVKSALFSVLLPGLGEYRLGHRSKAKYFFAVEAISWIGYFGYRTYGSWKRDDLVDYADAYAGANLENKDDDFLDFVGFYDDIDQYNSFGRAFDPDRPYLVDNTDNHWRWQSAKDKAIYRNLKNRSREAYRRASFMIGVAIVNRIISVIDVVRDARRARRTIDKENFESDGFNYRFDIDLLNPRQQFKLTFMTNL